MGRTKRARNKKSANNDNIVENNLDPDYNSSIIELLKWLGIKTQLQLFNFPQTGRGLRTQKLIKANEFLISVPLDKMITRTAIQHWYPKHWSTQLMLSCFLIQKNDEKSDYWTVYKRTLPRTYDVPFFDCPQELLEELPNSLKQLIENQSRLIHKQYEFCKKFLVSIDIQTFAWAWFTVNTRGVYFPDNNDNLALAPYLDMFNHNPNVKVEIKIQDDKYLIKSIQNWPKYGQVFINYGPHDNTKLYLEYGFVITDHPYDCVPLDIHDLILIKKTDIENIEKKINFIKNNHLNDNLKIFNTDEIVSWSVLACFYILDSFDVQKLFKVFEAELHIKNYQFEVRSLIEYQLKQVKKAQKKCFHQKTCQKSKILPKLLDIYHRLCEQSLNQVNHL